MAQCDSTSIRDVEVCVCVCVCVYVCMCTCAVCVCAYSHVHICYTFLVLRVLLPISEGLEYCVDSQMMLNLLMTF